MYSAYIDGSSKFVGKRSALSFTVLDSKGNIEYQHYELLDCHRNSSEIEMLAFNKLIEWLLENKIHKINVYTNSRHVYVNWNKSKLYSLNRDKLNSVRVRLIGNTAKETITKKVALA